MNSGFGGQVAITKEVENYPGFIEVGGFKLCEKFLQHAKSYNLEILEQEVIATEPGIPYHSVVTKINSDTSDVTGFP